MKYRIIASLLFLVILSVGVFYVLPNYIGDNQMMNTLLVGFMAILGYIMTRYARNKDIKKNNN
ncbi:hypothetical protein [Corticicoccus populi]|uniref:Uncharacterized protein n=1 Tax=Corticicoccus populi TaxID=1812821 RepID=A0ABW5X1I7_9STAP